MNNEFLDEQIHNVPEETGDFEAEVWLSTDNKNTVRILAKDRQGRRAGLLWAKGVYDRLRELYKTKQEANVDAYKQDLGKCSKCGAPNLLSKKGQPYCQNKCWLK